MSAEPSAGVRHIVKAFAFITTETLPPILSWRRQAAPDKSAL
jgi:hypothetical protein